MAIYQFNTIETGVTGNVTPANSGGSWGTAFTSVSGTVTYSTVTSIRGSKSLSAAISNGQSSEVFWSVSGVTEIWTRVYFRRANSANTATSTVITLNGGYSIGVGFPESGSPMSITESGAPRIKLVTGTYAHADNVWYRLEVYFKSGASGQVTARLYVGDDLSPADTITYNGSVPAISSVAFGVNTGQSNKTRTDYLDDKAISDNGSLVTGIY